ncbi:MAG: peptidase S8 [Proteobacteria bacterium]|nr:peptidase S8 [Pseudomonadota bacterium]MCP4920325.1 peptidase S8 [Pseudomonadota bacterium]
MSKPLSIALLLPTLLIGCATEEADLAPVLDDTEGYMDREILVAIDGADDGVVQVSLQKDFQLQPLHTNERIGVARLEIPEGQRVKDVVALLGEDHRVQFAEPNYLVKGQGVSDDPYTGYQWNLDQINAWEAWDIADGSGTIVAVLDTGVSGGGPDGIDNVLQGYDFYYNDSDPSDRVGHGTFVASTIAQSTDNGKGVAGVAPGAAILPVKVLGDNGYGDVSAIANGITWATDEGADVINMSLGSAYGSQTEERACNYAYERGVVLVAASGNEYSSRVGYPAAFDTVIAVGATRYDGSRAGYSNTGSGMELMAPGGDLSKDQDGDGYADGILQETIENGSWTYTFYEGTSMATPHVAAAAALLKSAGVDDPEDIRAALAVTAWDRGASGYDTSYGYGVIDAEAALEYVSGGGSPDQKEPEPETETEPEPTSDTTDPVISGVSGFTEGNSFTLEWVTNEPATSNIEFEGYGVYGNETLTHEHTLRFNGRQGSTYTFKFISTDEAGNTAETDWYQISL